MNNTYFSFNALISLRSSGYRNTSYAIAELIDNSFDAEAETVKVIFIDSVGSNGRKFIKEIIVADDGLGGRTVGKRAKREGGVEHDLILPGGARHFEDGGRVARPGTAEDDRRASVNRRARAEGKRALFKKDGRGTGDKRVGVGV